MTRVPPRQYGVQTSAPTVSLLIPTKNRRDDLLETLGTIATQTSLPKEIVIIDQSASSCEPQVRSVLQGCPSVPVRYVWAPEITDLIEARNRGIAEASGDVVFFVDDDITLRKDCLANLTARYVERPDVAGVCGVDMGGARVPWWLVMARRAYMLGPFSDERSLMNKRYERLTEPVPARLISGGYMSYRRWVFREFQFEGKLWGHRWNSSNDFSCRVSAKYPLIIDPKVCVLHRKPYGTYSPADFVKIRVSGAFYLFTRTPRRDLVGWAAFLWMLTAIFVRSVSRGVQVGALRVTLTTFATEVRRGFIFLKNPFEATY